MKGLGVLVLLIIIGIFYAVGKSSQTSAPTRQTVIPESVRSEAAALGNMDLKFSWHKGGFDAVAIADFRITNNNAMAVHDVTVFCEFRGDSGTLLTEHRETIFKTFPPKKTTTAKEISLGFIHAQVSKAACEISDLKL